MKRIVLVLLFAVGSHGARAQSTIAYTTGPYILAFEGSPATLDLDRDGSPDFSFTSTMPECLSDLSADGVHYVWVRVVRDRVALDWAYETRPGVPITAGAKPVPVPLASPEVVRPGYLRLKAATEAGKAYQVQAKGDLSAFLWTNLSFVIPAATTNIMVDLPINARAQYFRVVEAD